jgi:hypothetical protein
LKRSDTRRFAPPLALVAVVALAASLASAAPVASLVRVPISPQALAADPRLANFQTWDLRVHTDAGNIWHRTGLDARVTGGTFYNSELGSSVPFPHLWGAVPQLRYDTFITQAADPNDDTTFVIPIVNSAFPELPIRPPVFTDTHVSAHYAYTTAGAPATGPGEFTVARLTASEGAVVTMFGYHAQSEGPILTEPFAFTLVVPEPASSCAGWLLILVSIAKRQCRGERARS